MLAVWGRTLAVGLPAVALGVRAGPQGQRVIPPLPCFLTSKKHKKTHKEVQEENLI
jgi:hypothetical protein